MKRIHKWFITGCCASLGLSGCLKPETDQSVNLSEQSVSEEIITSGTERDTAVPDAFTVTAISGETSETGKQATFKIELKNKPTADVSLKISSSDLSEGQVSPDNLVFTTDNWNKKQKVTVTGVDDQEADGTQTYSVLFGDAVSADSAYNGIRPNHVEIKNLDNEDNNSVNTTAGFVISPISRNTTELGGGANFTIGLTKQPKDDVVINLTSSDDTEGKVEPLSLTFTTESWKEKLVIVMGVDDQAGDGSQEYKILTSVAQSNDAGFNGLDPDDITVVNEDNETAGVSVSPVEKAQTTEGKVTSVKIKLTKIPTASVTIPFSSSDTTEATVSPAQMVFTTENWNQEQLLTITPIGDLMADDDQKYSIVIGSAVSSDTGYNGLDPKDLDLTNIDVEKAGFIVVGSSLNITESGGKALYKVRLSSQPLVDVTVPVAVSSKPYTGDSVSSANLVFTPQNWNVEQDVTVSGTGDTSDGNRRYSIVLGPTISTSSKYNQVTSNPYYVTNTTPALRQSVSVDIIVSQ
ncbi:MAG: hypothetical protein HQM11_05775 [SAR324 cluster bacterium]|nr:hypothetical protein [SAR324 cluster bacterium]